MTKQRNINTKIDNTTVFLEVSYARRMYLLSKGISKQKRML